MTMVEPGRFRRLLLFRRRSISTQVLRVLEDGEGWYYIVNLVGTPDFGPYLMTEIVDAFDVECEPCAARDLAPAVGDTGAASN